MISPPEVPVLSWRSLVPADLPALTALAQDCRAVDGGLPWVTEPSYLQPRFFPGPPGTAVGAFSSLDGALCACAAVRAEREDAEVRTLPVGMVRPGFRSQGLGTYLLQWSLGQAQRLMAGYPASRQHIVHLSTEMLTPPAARLYAKFGFKQAFAEDVMRFHLQTPLPDVQLPPGLQLETWTPGRAGAFYTVYRAAFRERPGFPNWSPRQWITWVAEDDEFYPDLSLLVSDGGRPVAFIVCGVGFVIQMGVLPEWRGRGIGTAVLVEALKRFKEIGENQVLLDVNVNNPAAARLYAHIGFEVIGRRAWYVLESFEPKRANAE